MTHLRALGGFFLILGYVLSVVSASAQSSGEIVVGNIKGIINPVMAGYVSRVIDEAERSNAQAVVFYMDTPGGLSDSMHDINQRILAARVPVMIYVAPDGSRAGSAGVYICYAAHLVGMAPATNIGSATPVAMGEGGEQELSQEMRNKVTNDAVAQIRALAEQRGRDAAFAEQAVREGANLHAAEALRQNVVNYVAQDLPDLLRQADGATVRTAAGEVTLRTATAVNRPADMTPFEQFMLVVTNPTIAYILLSIGSLGLVVELYNPGSLFPGIAGAICLLLAFYALGTLPLNLAALGLLGFGILLFALEPFVTSHGVLSFGGAVAFAFGSLLLINAGDAPYLQIWPGAIAAATAIFLLLSLAVVGAVVQLRRRRPTTGREGLLGARGEVRRAIPPDGEGLVLTQSELWRARSPGQLLPAGTEVVVDAVDGLVLRVHPLAATTPASTAPLPPEPRPV